MIGIVSEAKQPWLSCQLFFFAIDIIPFVAFCPIALQVWQLVQLLLLFLRLLLPSGGLHHPGYWDSQLGKQVSFSVRVSAVCWGKVWLWVETFWFYLLINKCVETNEDAWVCEYLACSLPPFPFFISLLQMILTALIYLCCCFCKFGTFLFGFLL